MSKRVEAQSGNIVVNPITGVVQLFNADTQVVETTTTGAGGLLVDKGAGLEQIAVLSEITGSITTSTPFSIEADILTATPPTNEAVTGLLRFTDNDSTDVLGTVGYTASSVLQIANVMHGSNMEFIVENAAGAAQTLITLDPDLESIIFPTSNDVTSPTLAFGDGDTGFLEASDDSMRVAVGGALQWIWSAGSFVSSATNGVGLLVADPTGTSPNILPDKLDADTGIGRNAADQLSLVSGGVELIRATETGTATTDQVIIAPGATLRGATATPSLAFGDGDSGFYESLDDRIDVSLGGTTYAEFRAGYVILSGTGGNYPAIRNEVASNINPVFIPNDNDPDTGLGWQAADSLSLVAGGAEMLRLVETGTAGTDQIIVAPAGIIGAAATPALAFGDGDTGFYETADDQLRISVLGTERWQIDGSFLGSATSGAGFLTSAAATGTAPAHTFKGDTDTGIGTAAADQLSLISGGKEMLRLSETGTALTDQIIVAPAGVIGDAATPALAFGDGDSGFYESADDILWVTIAGGNKFRFQASTFVGNSSGAAYIQASAGSVSAPTYAINGDADTGIYSPGADALSISTGAVEAKRIQAATVQTTDASVTPIISIPVASGTGFGFRINIIGTEDSTGETMFESIFGAIRNQGGTTALVGSNIVDRTEDANASGWTVTVSADDTADALDVDVTGEVSNTIDWKVSVEILEV